MPRCPVEELINCLPQLDSSGFQSRRWIPDARRAIRAGRSKPAPVRTEADGVDTIPVSPQGERRGQTQATQVMELPTPGFGRAGIKLRQGGARVTVPPGVIRE